MLKSIDNFILFFLSKMNQEQINRWVELETNIFNNYQKGIEKDISITNHETLISTMEVFEAGYNYFLKKIDNIKNNKDYQQEEFDRYFKNTLTDDVKAFNQLFIDYIINGEGVKEIKGNMLIPTRYFLDIILPKMYNLYETSRRYNVNEIYLQHLEYHKPSNYSDVFEKRLYRNIMTFRVCRNKIKFENGTYMSVPKRVIKQLRNPK